MKYAVLILVLASLTGIAAQTPKTKVTPPKKTVAVKATPTPTPLTEKEQFAKASAYELASDRVEALSKFIAAFPESTDRPAAADLLASSRSLIAEEKLISGESADAVTIYRQLIEEAPQPIPQEMFVESISKIPAALYRRGQREAALELATLIEAKVENNPDQLLELANFYLALENGSEAMRIGAKAAAKAPESAAVHRMIALAHRINFDLDLAADSYTKAVSLEPDSVSSKRSLADMKRALGKSDEAVALYRELLAKNDADPLSRTGLVLALFDAGKRTEAETELNSALERSPNNIVLLAGAAYWYASRGIGDRAVELAQKAVDREPRYIWSHIALARGQMAIGKPVAAEQTLVKARAYGNFPTLEYELASARMAAGFFREAVEDLSRQFSTSPIGVKTNLGGRVPREEKSFADLVAHERRASIFTPVAADSAEDSEALRALLDLNQKLDAPAPNEAEVIAAVDAFTKGSGKMRAHRQLFAASRLLEKRIAIDKVIELTKAVTGNTDAALEVADPRAAVLASELYEARAAALKKGDFLLVPDVPKPMLSAILRGRVEEISGWALYQQNNFGDSVIRLRRAVSVMPADSAWWRSSKWRLGAALAADGKDSEALATYIDSYKIDKPDFGKYAVVEALYRKVHGSTDGLEALIGSERMVVSAALDRALPPIGETRVQPTPVTTPTEAPTATPVPVTTNTETDPPKSVPPATQDQNPPATKTETETQPAKTEPTITEIKQSPATDPPVTQTEVKPDPVTPPVETKTDVAPAKQTSEPPPPDSGKSAIATDPKTAAIKPLFEPIIITIPSNRPAKTTSATTTKPAADEKPADEKPSDTETKSDTPTTTADGRPRVIDGQEVTTDGPPPCAVGVSQENVSLINNGGSVGLLVSMEAPGDIKTLTAVSSSSKDIEVILEPEIGGVPDRRFFVIKSISTSLGVYQVAFTAPCGKKNIIVTVR